MGGWVYRSCALQLTLDCFGRLPCFILTVLKAHQLNENYLLVCRHYTGK